MGSPADDKGPVWCSENVDDEDRREVDDGFVVVAAVESELVLATGMSSGGGAVDSDPLAPRRRVVVDFFLPVVILPRSCSELALPLPVDEEARLLDPTMSRNAWLARPYKRMSWEGMVGKVVRELLL